MTTKNFLIKNIKHYHALFNKINLFTNDKTIIFLKGELGTGKTTFVQKYLQYKYKFENTSSPTFGIINTYVINGMKIYHYDLYRICKSVELDEIGFFDNLEDNTLHLIEWPEVIPEQMAYPNIIINFHLLKNERLISIEFSDE